VVTRLRPIAQRGDTLIVEAPNKLAADVVRERCLEGLQRPRSRPAAVSCADSR
jgi:hypothetical protein